MKFLFTGLSECWLLSVQDLRSTRQDRPPRLQRASSGIPGHTEVTDKD